MGPEPLQLQGIPLKKEGAHQDLEGPQREEKPGFPGVRGEPIFVKGCPVRSKAQSFRLLTDTFSHVCI